MDRLTERFNNGQAAVFGCGSNCRYDFKYCHNALEDCPAINKILERLAEYEDLEEKGQLLKPPCAVGDTVYRIHKATELSPDKVYNCRVTGVKQEYNSIYIKLYANINKETYSIWIDNWFDKCQMGYEFFLTEQEAEQALQKAKEDS